MKFLFAVLIVIFTAGYMLPWGVALVRGTKESDTVFFVNLFLGWSIIGWLVSFYLAVRD